MSDLQNRYHSRDIYLTPSGHDLLDREPETIECFVASAEQLVCTNFPREAFEWIDRGRFAHVYGLPGVDTMCLKVVSQKTMHDAWKTQARMRLPNLKAEARFMHKVGRLFGRKPEEGVHAPTQYGVAKFAGGAVLLQQRIPAEFATLASLRREAGDEDGKTIEQDRDAVVFTKVHRALGGSALRLGVGDIIGTGNVINGGNFLLERDKSLSESRVYAIDLIGQLPLRRAFAAGLAILHP